MKRGIQKLLAVVTFASAASTAVAAPRTLDNGAPAPGNTVAKGETYSRTDSALAAVQTARAKLSTAIAEEKSAAMAMKDEPRVLENGAPACGNMFSKVERECTTERSDAEWKERVQRLVQAGIAVRAAQTKLAAAERRYAKLGGSMRREVLASGGAS